MAVVPVELINKLFHDVVQNAKNIGDLMKEIKTIVKSAEASIMEGMQQKMLPLPNQVDMLGTLLQKTLSV